MTHSSDNSTRDNGTIMDNHEDIIDAELLALAESRLANYSPDNVISWEEMNRRLGITEEDLASVEKCEIE